MNILVLTTDEKCLSQFLKANMSFGELPLNDYYLKLIGDSKRRSIPCPTDGSGTKDTLTAVLQSIYSLNVLTADVLKTLKHGCERYHFDQVFDVINASVMCSNRVHNVMSRFFFFFFCSEIRCKITLVPNIGGTV